MADNEKKLSSLRLRVKSEVCEKRYRHILGVEECAVKMAEMYTDVFSEEDVYLIRVSALLHDVTKDKGDEWQKHFILSNNIKLPEGDEEAKQLWHSFTAPMYTALFYPDFSNETVISAIYKHATGDEKMSLTDKIICLADYIEDGRKYDSCVDVRNKFFGVPMLEMSTEERIKHLDKCLLLSFRYIEEHLLANREKMSTKTQRAVKALISEINSTEVL